VCAWYYGFITTTNRNNGTNNNDNNNNNNFYVLYYQFADTAAIWPVTHAAQEHKGKYTNDKRKHRKEVIRKLRLKAMSVL
jgi:hypothetical protein